MPRKTFSPEQIIAKLRQIEVLLSQGHPTTMACKEAGISEQTYYRWRKEYGRLRLDQARRLKDLGKVKPYLKGCQMITYVSFSPVASELVVFSETMSVPFSETSAEHFFLLDRHCAAITGVVTSMSS